MKAIMRLAISLITLLMLCAGCGAAPPVSTTINELTSNPAQFSGKTVTFEGIYVRGWEWLLISDSVAYIGSGDARELRPVGDSIWFAGLVPKEIQDGLYSFRSATGDTTYFGKVRVTGKFETEGGYGHTNQYKYRITATKVELLDWTPPE